MTDINLALDMWVLADTAAVTAREVLADALGISPDRLGNVYDSRDDLWRLELRPEGTEIHFGPDEAALHAGRAYIFHEFGCHVIPKGYSTGRVASVLRDGKLVKILFEIEPKDDDDGGDGLQDVAIVMANREIASLDCRRERLAQS